MVSNLRSDLTVGFLTAIGKNPAKMQGATDQATAQNVQTEKSVLRVTVDSLYYCLRLDGHCSFISRLMALFLRPFSGSAHKRLEKMLERVEKDCQNLPLRIHLPLTQSFSLSSNNPSPGTNVRVPLGPCYPLGQDDAQERIAYEGRMLDQFKANGLVKPFNNTMEKVGKIEVNVSGDLLKQVQDGLSLSPPIETGTGTQIPDQTPTGEQVYAWPGTGEHGTIKKKKNFFPLDGNSPRSVKSIPNSPDSYQAMDRKYKNNEINTVSPAPHLHEYSCAFRSPIFGMRWLEGQPIDSKNLDNSETQKAADANFGTVSLPNGKTIDVNGLRRGDAELLAKDREIENPITYTQLSRNDDPIPYFWDLSAEADGKPHEKMPDICLAQSASARILQRKIVVLESKKIEIFTTNGAMVSYKLPLPLTEDEWKNRSKIIQAKRIGYLLDVYEDEIKNTNSQDDESILNWAEQDLNGVDKAFWNNTVKDFLKETFALDIEEEGGTYANYVGKCRNMADDAIANAKNKLAEDDIGLPNGAKKQEPLFLFFSQSGTHCMPMLKLSKVVE
ncbi:MAG: hypothetical protein LBT98_01600 [Puniceicoccales bacterium]|jgi:hypothetical protein|nr:hypothetical protein [Puniceicoccales bacterium]